jgi:hypothetical protein
MEWVDFVFEVVKGMCKPHFVVERKGDCFIVISIMLDVSGHPPIKPSPSDRRYPFLTILALEKPTIQVYIDHTSLHAVRLKEMKCTELDLEVDLNDQKQTDVLKEIINNVLINGREI